jgi:pimeloyl-ACP methyl ester carboxylesterase
MTSQRFPATFHEFAVCGIRMHCEIVGGGPPLLLLHGFTGAACDWRSLHDRWAGRWRLIIPDLRGHGRSTKPAGVYTHRQAGRDVLALLDHLGIECVRAVGVSGGGNALLHLAVDEPSRVEAMVLVSAATHYGEEARAFQRGYTVETRTPEQWTAMRARHPGGDDQILSLWSQVRAFADSEDRDLTPAQLSTIRARTLLVSGENDPLVPPAVAQEMKWAIPGSKLWLVPGGGHIPVTGSMRDIFLDTVDAFIDPPRRA